MNYLHNFHSQHRSFVDLSCRSRSSGRWLSILCLLRRLNQQKNEPFSSLSCTASLLSLSLLTWQILRYLLAWPFLLFQEWNLCTSPRELIAWQKLIGVRGLHDHMSFNLDQKLTQSKLSQRIWPFLWHLGGCFASVQADISKISVVLKIVWLSADEADTVHLTPA